MSERSLEVEGGVGEGGVEGGVDDMMGWFEGGGGL